MARQTSRIGTDTARYPHPVLGFELAFRVVPHRHRHRPVSAPPQPLHRPRPRLSGSGSAIGFGHWLRPLLIVIGLRAAQRARRIPGVFDRRASPLAVMDRRSGDAESFWTGSVSIAVPASPMGWIGRVVFPASQFVQRWFQVKEPRIGAFRALSTKPEASSPLGRSWVLPGQLEADAGNDWSAFCIRGSQLLR